MEIMAVDATHPGSCHDSFVWSTSMARDYFERASMENTWILADSGYPLESYMLTPYRSPQYGTVEHAFNIRHSAARNVVERTIGLLKSRFRCLQAALPYAPALVCQMVNVCCALHNICRRQAVSINEAYTEIEDNELNSDDPNIEEPDNENASRIRDQIAHSFL